MQFSRRIFTYVRDAIILVLLSSSTVSQAQTARQFAEKYLSPLIGPRQELFKLTINESKGPGQPAQIIIQSRTSEVSLGRYEINLGDQFTMPLQAPAIQLIPARKNGVDFTQIKATIALPLNPQEDPAPVIRSMLRSDFLLHPMQAPPGWKPRLAPTQADVVNQLTEFSEDAFEKGEAGLSIVILPPGFGKTVIAGRFLKEEAEASDSPYHVLFVVQNKDILDEATTKLQKILDLSPAQVRRVYGENSGQELLDDKVILTSTTRTTLMRNLNEVIEAKAKMKGRLLVVIDEAHHAGKLNGEFDTILTQLNSTLKKGDFLLGLTATPWHMDSDLIERLFKNNVATALLKPEEKQSFLEQRKLIFLSRLMLFRAMAEGYLSPIQSYRQVRYLNEEGELPVLARDFLNDWSRRFEGLDENERLELLKKDLIIHVPLIKQMVKEILSTIKRDGEDTLITPNRGIVFVPSIAHANIYAYLLSQRGRGNGKTPIVAKPYHSGLSDEERAETMDWFRDQEIDKKTGARVARQTDKKEPIHKYLFAIRALGEGVDEPRINHIILAKPYSEQDPVGMRDLIQNLGRGSRLSYPKADFTISDFTGDMKRLIFDDMDQALVSQFFVEGGEKDFAPQPVSEKKEKEKPEVYLDHVTLKPENFDAESVSIPERHFVTPTPVESLKSEEKPPASIKAPAFVLDAIFPNEVEIKGFHTWRQFLELQVSREMIEPEFPNANERRDELKDIRSSLFDILPSLGTVLSKSLDGASRDMTLMTSPDEFAATMRHLGILRSDFVESRDVGDSLWKFLAPEFAAYLDAPVPWRYDGGNLEEGFRPTFMEAMMAIRRQWLLTNDRLRDVERFLTWDEVLDEPGFLDLLVRKLKWGQGSDRVALMAALMHNPISLRTALKLPSKKTTVHRPGLTPTVLKNLYDLLTPIRKDIRYLNTKVRSQFRTKDLLMLPASLVWARTLSRPIALEVKLIAGSTIHETLKNLKGPERQDFAQRLQVLFQMKTDENLEKVLSERRRTIDNLPNPVVTLQDEVRKNPLSFPLEPKEIISKGEITWREFLQSEASGRLFAYEFDLPLEGDRRDKWTVFALGPGRPDSPLIGKSFVQILEVDTGLEKMDGFDWKNTVRALIGLGITNPLWRLGPSRYLQNGDEWFSLEFNKILDKKIPWTNKQLASMSRTEKLEPSLQDVADELNHQQAVGDQYVVANRRWRQIFDHPRYFAEWLRHRQVDEYFVKAAEKGKVTFRHAIVIAGAENKIDKYSVRFPNLNREKMMAALPAALVENLKRIPDGARASDVSIETFERDAAEASNAEYLTIKELLKLPAFFQGFLESADLNARAMKADYIGSEIHSVWDLMESEREVLRIPNFGRGSLVSLNQALESAGLWEVGASTELGSLQEILEMRTPLTVAQFAGTSPAYVFDEVREAIKEARKRTPPPKPNLTYAELLNDPKSLVTFFRLARLQFRNYEFARIGTITVMKLLKASADQRSMIQYLNNVYLERLDSALESYGLGKVGTISSGLTQVLDLESSISESDLKLNNVNWNKVFDDLRLRMGGRSVDRYATVFQVLSSDNVLQSLTNDLSVRAHKNLFEDLPSLRPKKKLRHLLDLVALHESEIINLPSAGARVVNEIEEFLKRLGLNSERLGNLNKKVQEHLNDEINLEPRILLQPISESDADRIRNILKKISDGEYASVQPSEVNRPDQESAALLERNPERLVIYRDLLNSQKIFSILFAEGDFVERARKSFERYNVTTFFELMIMSRKDVDEFSGLGGSSIAHVDVLLGRLNLGQIGRFNPAFKDFHAMPVFDSEGRPLLLKELDNPSPETMARVKRAFEVLPKYEWVRAPKGGFPVNPGKRKLVIECEELLDPNL